MLSTKEATPIFKADEALSVRLEFGISIPKSYTGKKREACLAGQIVPMKKPDIDNLVKAVLDALNGCMYEDDKQIIKVIAEKCYAGRPYVEVKCESDESKGEEVR